MLAVLPVGLVKRGNSDAASVTPSTALAAPAIGDQELAPTDTFVFGLRRKGFLAKRRREREGKLRRRIRAKASPLNFGHAYASTFGTGDTDSLEWSQNALIVSPFPPYAQNAVLRCLAKRLQWQLAVLLLNDMWLHAAPSPDKSSFSTVIGLLERCGLPRDAERLYRRAASAGAFAHWTTERDGLRHAKQAPRRAFAPRSPPPCSNEKPAEKWVLDLHGCSLDLARVVVRVAIIDLGLTGSALREPLTIITGVGAHSALGAEGSLRSSVEEFFASTGGVTRVTGNEGRLLVSPGAIDYMRKRAGDHMWK